MMSFLRTFWELSCNQFRSHTRKYIFRNILDFGKNWFTQVDRLTLSLFIIFYFTWHLGISKNHIHPHPHLIFQMNGQNFLSIKFFFTIGLAPGLIICNICTSIVYNITALLCIKVVFFTEESCTNSIVFIFVCGGTSSGLRWFIHCPDLGKLQREFMW